MKYYLGIDLGSTTSKAVIIDENEKLCGRGITNTRANYEVAAEIAKQQAIYNTRFTLLKEKFLKNLLHSSEFQKFFNDLENTFQYIQFKDRWDKLKIEMMKQVSTLFFTEKEKLKNILQNILNELDGELKHKYFNENLGAKNQFFRDIVSEVYNQKLETTDKQYFEPLMNCFDKSINFVENEYVDYNFEDVLLQSIDILQDHYEYLLSKDLDEINTDFRTELEILSGNYKEWKEDVLSHIKNISNQNIVIANMVGTGYGRALLPFPQDCIRSEILCHAFGAHFIFPNTRTVLDIGGQDTKAIQVDKYGMVTSFHMNDRCAAGCGRYLGYIANEFGFSLNELGPMTLQANRETNICSTCTVFAGAEVRELLNMGEKKEDILAGLHKAIVSRAMSLIARSGGVFNEFTFTGGVARNQAIVKYVSEFVRKNYGEDIKINIHTDSIFMGSLGGALFAKRNLNVSLNSKPEKIKN
ncbi:MAG TPA: BadF/BadG/BcrA/BcrD ATPase family protein [Bacteroidia bacterium]|nr:BadF/BadG/BcrA/BcrD ATPase family protein [Bacteroidia bacterium]